MADAEFSGSPRCALLQIMMAALPFGTFLIGLSGDILAMVDHAINGHLQEFIIVLVFFLLPMVLLLIATLIGAVKEEDEDPEIVRNNRLIRALYFAFHVKLFHLYLENVRVAVMGVCGCAPHDPNVENTKRTSRAALHRRWVSYLDNAPLAVFHMYVIFSRVIANGGELPPSTPNLQYAVAASMFGLGCVLTGHHNADTTKPYDAVYAPFHRVLATATNFFFKLLFILSRTITFAFFLYTFGELFAIPVVLHGIAVMIVFMVLAKPAIDSAYTFLKVVILSYTQFFDVNDVWINELGGTKIITITYYIVATVFNLALVISSFLSVEAPDAFKLNVLIVMLVTWVGAIAVRLFYFNTPLYPKEDADGNPV